MLEQRGRQHGMERRAEALRDEIGVILEGDLADPRIGLATVSEVVLNPGGKSARVFVRVDGPQEDADETFAGLLAAKGFIRATLTERLGLRHCPDLIFIVESNESRSGRVDQLLARVQQRARKKKGTP